LRSPPFHFRLNGLATLCRLNRNFSGFIMQDILARLVQEASGTLTQLTKVRCVENYPLPSDVKPKNLFSWPNTRYLDEKGSSLLVSRGVRLYDNHVKSFSVGYSLYDAMEKVDDENVTIIQRTRILLDLFQIIYGKAPVIGITAAWNAEDNPDRVFPTTVSDAESLKRFSAHKDSFLVISREGQKYDIKLRASAFSLVLSEKPELKELQIHRGRLKDFSGDGVDHRGRKNRNIVFRAHKHHFQDVVCQTNDAVEKLIANADFVSNFNRLDLT